MLVWLDEKAENPDMEKEYRAKINVFGRETSYVTPEEYFSLNANIDISTLNIVDNNKCANFIFNLFKNHNNIEDSKNYCSDIGDSEGRTFKNDIKDAQDLGEYFPAGFVQEMINKNIISCSYEPIISYFYNGDFYQEYGKEIDVVIPKQFTIYTIEVKENPTIEDINNCITSMKGDDYSEQDAITICNGGEVSGTSLETLRLELYYMPFKMIEKEYSMYKLVPAITKNLKVTKIGVSAFSNIKSIIIPEGVTEIESYAFYQNQLTDIVLPSTLQKIGEKAFYDNYINEIIIPDNVELIGEHAFAFNNITRVEMGNSIKKIGKWSFAYNTILNLNLKESKNDITIDEYAFIYNEIPFLSIPDSIVSIGEQAFSFNALNTIYIGTKSKLIENDGISGGAFLSSIDKILYLSSYVTGASKNLPTAYYNNIELSIVYNNSGKVFDWKNIFGSYIYSGNGITGVVKINDNRQINIITGENS